MRLYLSSFRMGNAPEELVKLCRGKKAAIIANSTDFKTTQERAESVQLEVDNLQKLGFESEEVDLRKFFGKADELAATLSGFDLIWVRGGNVFILMRAVKESGFDTVLKKLLLEDKVAYGGYSAGIDVLSPSIRGCELVDDPNDIPEGYDSEIVWEGLGLLPYIVAPHYQSNHPESEDINKMVEYLKDKKVAYKTLRDGEAILINAGVEKIVGHPDSQPA